MKILVLGTIPLTFGGKISGGIATHIEGFSTIFSERGNETTLWYHKLSKKYSKNRVNVIGNNLLSYLTILKYLHLFFHEKASNLSLFKKVILIYQYSRLKTILKENSFDVIHIHSYFNTSGIALQLLKSKTPVVFTDHGFWQYYNFESSMNNQICNENLKIANKIIYISDYSYSQNMKYNFNHQNKLVKIKNPINVIPSQDSINLEASNKKIIFFNGISETIKRKQLDILLQAIEIDPLLREETKAVVIVNELGIKYINENNFSFPIEKYNGLSWEEIKKRYLQCDLLVVPSTSESFGLVYIEALSYGKPIIGYDKVVKEFKKDYGVYIGEEYVGNDIKELSLKIKTALEADFNENILIDKTYNLFSWEKNIIKFETLYKELIALY